MTALTNAKMKRSENKKKLAERQKKRNDGEEKTMKKNSPGTIIILAILIAATLLMNSCAAEHVHNFGNFTVTKNPTCVEAGEQERLCSCGQKQSQAIPALGHLPRNPVKENEKSPTCTEDGGYDVVTYCSRCGEEISRTTTTIEAPGHKKGNLIVDKAATCTESGTGHYECTVCGEKIKEQSISAGHEYGDWITEKAAKCEEEGIRTRTCTVCGNKETDRIAPTGHKWIAATCTEPKKCSKCGKTDGEALGHSYKDGVCSRCKAKPEAILIMPEAGGTYTYGKSTIQVVEISSVEHHVWGWTTGEYRDEVTINLLIKLIYDPNGHASPRLRFKMYDSKGTVVASGYFYYDTINIGEKCVVSYSQYLIPEETYTFVFVNN